MSNVNSVEQAQHGAHLSQLRWMIADIVCWIAMLAFGFVMRHDLQLDRMGPGHSNLIGLHQLLVTVAAIVTAIAVGSLAGLYSPIRRVWPGSHTEIVVICAVHACAALLGCGVAMTVEADGGYPRSVPLIAGGFVIATAITLRSLWRWGWLRVRRNPVAERLLIYGAGVRSFQYLSNLPTATISGASQYRPVAVFAEDPRHVGQLVHGLRVLSTTEHELQSTIERTAARTMLLIPEAKPNPDTVRMIKEVCDTAGVRVLILPSESELDAPKPDAPRELSVSDLIGRPPVDLDEEAMRGVIAGKRVLVTGAGGSIGSELCRQVHRLNPAELIMLDRDEGGLHATELSLYGTALLNGRGTVLADIRDARTIYELFQQRRPQVVFHAAALKHQPLLEQYPTEAVQTNVVGTQNVLDAAEACGVETLVNISTDKAANPTSVLGESKRVAERLTARMSRRCPGTWVSVRFGNVFGSRGSVLHTFTRQIEEGGPVTVTDPKVERFFMTIPEACQLVVQAAAVGVSGETLVLEMGKPVRIADLARQLIEFYGREDVEITYTGLRPGEKLSEELVDDSETPTSGDRHELVTEVTVSPFQLDAEAEHACQEIGAARAWLQEHGASRSIRGSLQPVQAGAEAAQ